MFKSLKSNFMQLDIKESFMDGLLDGRPCEFEQAYHDEFEVEINKISEELKSQKSLNEEAKTRVEAVVTQICNQYEAYVGVLENIRQTLTELKKEEEVHKQRGDLSQIPSLTDGPSVEECTRLQKEADQEALRLESELAAAAAEITDARAALKAEAQELAELECKANSYEALAAAQKNTSNQSRPMSSAEVEEQLRASEQWFRVVSEVLSQLGGLWVEEMTPLPHGRGHQMRVRLEVLVPRKGVHQLVPGLVSETEPMTLTGNLNLTLTAELAPATVELDVMVPLLLAQQQDVQQPGADDGQTKYTRVKVPVEDALTRIFAKSPGVERSGNGLGMLTDLILAAKHKIGEMYTQQETGSAL